MTAPLYGFGVCILVYVYGACRITIVGRNVPLLNGIIQAHTKQQRGHFQV